MVVYQSVDYAVTHIKKIFLVIVSNYTQASVNSLGSPYTEEVITNEVYRYTYK
jgi:hypothetical protein